MAVLAKNGVRLVAFLTEADFRRAITLTRKIYEISILRKENHFQGIQ